MRRCFLAAAALFALTAAEHHPLFAAERRQYSQQGEDGVIAALVELYEVACPEPVPRYYVEIGTESCAECNSRALRSRGWRGAAFDLQYSDASINLTRARVTAENAPSLLAEAGVPRHFGVLSVDIDFNDLYVTRACLAAGYRPDILVLEVNGKDGDYVVPYDALGGWDHSDYFGASTRAMAESVRQFGYTVVYVESRGVNAFFVRDLRVAALLPGAGDPDALHVTPRYGVTGRGHPVDALGRPWLTAKQATALTSPPRPSVRGLRRHTLKARAVVGRDLTMYLRDTMRDVHVVGMIERDGMWEAHGVRAVAAALRARPGSLFVDGGTHLGQYSLVAAALGHDVVLIEGQSDNLGAALASLEANGLRHRVRAVVAQPVSDRAGQVVWFDIPADNNGGTCMTREARGRVDPSFELGRDFGVTTTMDYALRGVRNETLVVKLDIEGAESRAVLGGRRFLGANRLAWLVAEWWTGDSRATTTAEDREFVRVLRANGLVSDTLTEKTTRSVHADLVVFQGSR